MKFISDEEFKELKKAETPELFNEILSRVCNAAIENTIRRWPDVATRLTATAIATKAATKEFYDKNKDFIDHKDIVTAVVQDIDSKDPTLSYGEMLKKAEPIVREKIKNEKLHKGLPCALPDKVNLKGNGVI